MKKIFTIFFTLIVGTMLLTACQPKNSSEVSNTLTPTPENTVSPTTDATETLMPPDITPTPTVNVVAENTLTTAGEKITLGIIDSKLYITYLGTVNSDVNMIAEKSQFSLPKYGVSGWSASEWTFISDEKIKGKIINEVKTDGVIYHFEEQNRNLKLRVYCLVRPDVNGAFEFYTELENMNDSEIRMVPAKFASFNVSTPNYEKTNIVKISQESRQAEGFIQPPDEQPYVDGPGIYITPMGPFNMDTDYVTEITGRDREDKFLSYYLDHNSENGLFVALEWTHGRVSSKRTGMNSMEFAVDMDIDGSFSTIVHAGETFVFPSTYIMPYDGNVDNGSNKFKSWFFDCKVQPELRNNENEPFTQIDQVCMQYPLISEIGFESVKWDYGWWTYHGHAWPYSYEGSWIVRRGDALAAIANVGCENLAQYGAFLKRNGVNFTVYILLHDMHDMDGNVTDEMGEFNSITHPEWFINQYGNNDPMYADLGDVNCVAYLKDAMYHFFADNNVTTWRSDFDPIPFVSDKKNRHDSNGSDVMYWNTKGFTEIIDYLYENVEGFRYECCSLGGNLKDLYMATKAIIFNCDDSANYLSLRTSFYDSSYIIHPSQLQQPANIDFANTDFWPYIDPAYTIPTPDADESYDFHQTMIDMGLRSTFLGVPHWCSWSNSRSYDEYYKKYIPMYKEKIRPLVRHGELYHILPRPDGKNWDGIMYADPDSNNEIKGAVFLFKPSAEVNEIYNVVFEGLNEDTVYSLTFEDRPEQNCTATGKALMTEGLDVEIEYIGSEIIWITEAK